MNTTVNSTTPISTSMNDLRISTAVLGSLIYVAGILGNFFSFLFFCQKEIRQVSTGLIFLLLNVFSTIHLLSLIVEFLDSIFQVQIFASDIFRCQFILWLQNTTRTVCAFLATTVSIDRFLRSEFPIKSRNFCTTRNVLKLFGVYLLFSTSFYAFFFDPSNLFDSFGQCSFSYNRTFRFFALNIIPSIRFVTVCIMPTIVMLICGGKMLFNIRRSRQRVASRKTGTSPTIVAVVVPMARKCELSNDKRRQLVTLDQMLVLMVLANVIAYIVTQIPFNAYTLYYGYESSNDYTTYSLTRAFLLMWGSIYFGIGFYLFSLTSAQFRRQFTKKLKTFRFCLCRR